MSTFRIALLQMSGHGYDQDKNLEKGLEYCRHAHDMGADLALFPEMWNIGYHESDLNDPDHHKAFLAQAITIEDDFMAQHMQLARELHMGIAVTYLESYPERPRNSMSIIDKSGNVCLTYAKVHTCDFGVIEASCTPGEGFYVNDFDCEGGSVKLGAMICYDREAPEAARILMLKGAEIVVTPNACGLDSRRIHQFESRAFENAMGMAMTNYGGPPHNGHSVAFDVDGGLIVETGQGECIRIAEFDLDRIRAYRQDTVWGNGFRRPHRYADLLSMHVDEVFKRINAFDEDFIRGQR